MLFVKKTTTPIILLLTQRYLVTAASFLKPQLNFLLSEFIAPQSSSITRSNQRTTFNMAHMDSPSAQRNKDPIWGELKKLVPQLKLLSSSPTGDKNDDPNDNNVDTALQVLEIAAGVGVHTLHFVSKMTSELNQNVYWYPSDPDETSRNSILARVQSCKTSKIQESIYTPPLALTLGTDGILEEVDGVHDYSQIIVEGNIDLITCINMIHISPWEATIGLFKLASNKLKCGGILYCYGPYKVNGSAVESNL